MPFHRNFIIIIVIDFGRVNKQTVQRRVKAFVVQNATITEKMKGSDSSPLYGFHLVLHSNYYNYILKSYAGICEYLWPRFPFQTTAVQCSVYIVDLQYVVSSHNHFTFLPFILRHDPGFDMWAIHLNVCLSPKFHSFIPYKFLNALLFATGSVLMNLIGTQDNSEK